MQKSFLSNERNKQNFIDLLAGSLQSNGYTVVQSEDDADIDIVSTVINIASEGKNVTLVGADTDLLILLLYMWNESMGHIIMKCEGTRKHPEVTRNIRELAKCVPDLCSYLTFIHAFGGCDTTSATFGVGKMAIMKQVEKKKIARQVASVFLSPESTQENIGEQGAKLFVMLYGGKTTDTLNELRDTRNI